MRTCLTLIVAVALAVSASAAQMGYRLTPQERESLAIAHEASAYRAILALGLTDAQKQALMPVLTQHVKDLIAIREAEIAAQPAAEAGMAGLRAAVMANNGVSDEVKGSVYRAEAPYKVLEKKRELRDPERATQVWSLLTTAQGARFRRNMRPVVAYQDDAGWSKAAAARLDYGVRDPQRALTRLYRDYGLLGEEVTRAVAFGTPSFQEWQALPREQALARRDEYVRLLIALPGRGLLSAKPEPMTERALLGAVLTQKTLHLLNPAVPLPPVDAIQSDTLGSMTTDVQVLNLVNSLYLTPEQMRSLIAAIKQTTPQYEQVNAERQALAQRSLPLLRQVRDAYARGEWPTPATQSQLLEVERSRGALAQQEQHIAATALADLKKLLTDNQVAMVANFVPCTVPVQSLTNPERVGQVNDNSGVEQALTRLRRMPEERLPAAIEEFQSRIELQYKLKHYRAERIKPVLDQVPEVVAQARAMSDADFEFKKGELAAKISVPQIDPLTGAALDNRITTYLLCPNLVPLLEGRLAGK